MRAFQVATMAFALLAFSGCHQKYEVDTTHKVQLEVKPMHITIDINLKVDKALDDFFGDIDKQDSTLQTPNTESKMEDAK